MIQVRDWLTPPLPFNDSVVDEPRPIVFRAICTNRRCRGPHVDFLHGHRASGWSRPGAFAGQPHCTFCQGRLYWAASPAEELGPDTSRMACDGCGARAMRLGWFKDGVWLFDCRQCELRQCSRAEELGNDSD